MNYFVLGNGESTVFGYIKRKAVNELEKFSHISFSHISFSTYFFFHSAPEEGLYCKPKNRAILFKII